VVEAVRGEGGHATAAVADATRADEVARAFDAAEAAGGAPQLVVFNAGRNELRPVLEMDADFFEKVWRATCLGGFVVGREAARRMLPGGGTLLFTGATASLKARPPFTAFASAKAALRALAFGMARELGPQGLHVGHVIIDGVIDGDVIRSRFPQMVERKGENGLLAPDAIADAYWALHRQHPTAWTLELDLRPYKEPF